MDEREIERQICASFRLKNQRLQLETQVIFTEMFLFDENKNEEPQLSYITNPHNGSYHIPFKTTKWQGWVKRNIFFPTARA